MITLAMLVKNEEANIATAINSVKNVVSEILVVDDSSSDRTVEIATALGAKCIKLPRPVSEIGFAEAVNFMIGECTQEWILMLDADEFLEAVDLHPLTRWTDKVAWSLPRRKWLDYKNGQRTELEAYPDFQPKFFKRIPEHRFSGEMHIRFAAQKVWKSWRGPHIEHLQEECRNPEKIRQRKELYESLAKRQGVQVVGGEVAEIEDVLGSLDY